LLIKKLDGEDESGEDTEFEDDNDVKLPMPIRDKMSAYSSTEQKRALLEEKLGAKNFLQVYPQIQVNIYSLPHNCAR
jgi:hypothetical protein